MARFASQVDGEPLMRLERPSTASSQTTAHIINACFNEILSQKQLDSKEINNLAVSKKENSDSDFQDYYVEKLTQISEESRHRLEELSQVERHLMQARAKALADDEKNIAVLINSCPSYKTIGLPQGPSQFRKYVNEELLSQHNLLVPSHYLPKQTAGPCDASTTDTSRHIQLPHKSQEPLTSLPSRDHRPPWRNSLTASERHAEKQVLSHLDQKTAFLKNPKFSKDVNNTASSGPLKQKRKLLQQQQQKSYIPDSFSIKPKEVLFSVYHPGESVQQVVEFKNIGGVSRYLRLTGMKSDYFSISSGRFPTEEGLVAPGMICSFTVTFTPDSLANYREDIKVVTCNGEYYVVPLIGMRPPPELSLPSVLDCGSCLDGDSKKWTTQCVNFGGEGRFKLMLPTQKDDIALDTDSIAVGPFLVSPKEFYISASGGCVDVSIVFTPPKIGTFTHELHMACDNGQVLTYTLTGMAEKICLGCTQVRQSSMEEVNSFTVNVNTDNVSNVAFTSSGNYEDKETLNIIATPSVLFDAANPNSSTFQTVLIHNFSHVAMPYIWRYYRPLTENQEDDPIPSENSPFYISPSNGTIGAGQAATFVIRFHPKELGSFVDMGYLTLQAHINQEAIEADDEGTGWIKLPDSRIAVCCLQMQGACEPFSVEMSPPAIIIPGEIPIFMPLRKRFKMNNNSISSVHYQWSSYERSGVSITVDTDYGRIVSGGSCSCEVSIIGHSEGPFSCTLLCSLKGFPANFSLPIRGSIQKPVVSLDCGYFDFSLIPFGRSASLKVCLSNESNSTPHYCFKQLVQERPEGFMDHQCLTFSPDEGDLVPHGSNCVTVQCQPQHSGRLRSVVQLLVNGQPDSCVSVEAEVQRPGLCLDSCQHHFTEIYVGIPHTHNLLLRNNSLITAHFTWSSQAFGGDGKHCKIDIKCMTGHVGPKEDMVVPVDITWTEQGSFTDVILKCDVLDMENPIFVLLSADVKGLSVVYRLLPNENAIGDQDPMEEAGEPVPTHNDAYLLDFGHDNELGCPVSTTIMVVNTSAVPASVQALVSHFRAAAATIPEPLKVRNNSLSGKSTNLIVKSGIKTTEQNLKEYISSLLSDDHGVCFVVTPSDANLSAFGSLILKITAYSNMWGEYSDRLTCYVDGLKSTIFHMKVGFVGCPVEFQHTATSRSTLVRFGTHPIGANPIKRLVKMKNTSPVALRVNWMVFDIVSEDDQIVDLIATFGDPFPKARNILALKDYSDEDTVVNGNQHHSNRHHSDQLHSNRHHSDQLHSSRHHSYQHHNNQHQSNQHSNQHRHHSHQCHSNQHDSSQYDSGEDVEEMVVKNDDALSENDKIVSILIKQHEGQQTSVSPYSISQKKMLIPAHGKATMEVTYKPSSSAFTVLGDESCSYILGYINIDDSNSPNVAHATGYDIEPLRIDLMAAMEEPRFIMECDEDLGLHFECPASLLLKKNGMQIKPEALQVHSFTLINPTSSIQDFDFCTTSSHFFVADVKADSNRNRSAGNPSGCLISVDPGASVQFSVKFSFSPNDLSPKPNAHECHFEGKLQIKFSFGVVQEFVLSATVKLPALTLSGNYFDVGTVLLGESSSSFFSITNPSSSKALWSVTVSQELANVIQVSPHVGVLNPHLYEGKFNHQRIEVSFSPQYEISYSGSLFLKEILTGKIVSLKITGNGSADEHHSKVTQYV